MTKLTRSCSLCIRFFRPSTAPVSTPPIRTMMFMPPLANPIVFLPLSQGKVAVIDFSDFEKVGRAKWFASRDGNTFYAHREVRGRTRRLHRELLDAPAGTQVDHKDGDGLNNCRGNLRLCTGAENTRNQRHRAGSSQFKGVYRHRGKWSARILVDGKRKHLGCFLSEIDAAYAYDIAAKQHFGEFARPNK